jgi:hypothetical protein
MHRPDSAGASTKFDASAAFLVVGIALSERLV